MIYKALVVEDDPQVVNLIADALSSLGHEYDTAASQEEAVQLLKANRYHYVLLDIQIPARAKNGVARIQNTENLLEIIEELLGDEAPPIIVLSDYAVEGLERTVDVMRLAIALGRKGAADIIGKPFPTAGRTLDRVIKKILGIRVGAAAQSAPTLPVRPAEGAAPRDRTQWLSVTEAAMLLLHDLPGLDLAKARSRISTAASRDEFKFKGARKDRRIEPVSFDAWRLRQRDRDLDEEDE